MKAVLLKEIGKPFVIEDVPRPIIGTDEVLIQTRACGICRTDIHIQDGLAYVPSLPHIPGHEPAGVVVEMGGGVRELKVGDRVVPHLFITRGNELIDDCSNAPSATVKDILGVTCAGGFAEFFKAPAKNLLKLPSSVSFEHGGLVSCAIITAMHAYHRSCAMEGEIAAVMGIGGIGIVQIQILKGKGLKVAAISRSSKGRDLARQAGADLCVTPKDAVDAIKALTKGRGAPIVFDMVGIEKTMKLGIDLLGVRGRLVMVGEEEDCLPINTIQIAQRELQIIGSRNGGLNDAKESLDLMAKGVIKPHIDRRYPLEHFNEAIERVRKGVAHGRVVITLPSKVD